MKLPTLAVLAGLAASALTGCATVEDVPQESMKMEDWQDMPLPITQRYPMIEVETVPGSASAASRGPMFSCSEPAESSLLQDLPTLDVSFIETDIADALLELSLQTGVSIITDDSLEGLVSVSFTGKSLEEVVAAVIAPGNFGYKVFDSFIYVGSQSPASPSFHLLSETCMYKPVFIKPEQIVDMLTPYYQQYVNFNEGHDYISIVAPESIQERIQQDIQIFDKAPPQILLEMSIIEVSEEALDMLGVKWNRRIGAEQLLTQNGGSTNSLITLAPARDSASPLAQALLDSISALDTDEALVVKAMPSMVTLNGKEANFSSTQTSWLPVAASTPETGQRDTAVDYGVNLRIVPYVSNDAQVRLEILQASVSDLTEDFNDDPKLISHGITTSVLMNDGETLVLGGLLQKKRRNQGNRVPGASQTPVFGSLFRQKEAELVDTEVLIMIRPQVMKG